MLIISGLGTASGRAFGLAAALGATAAGAAFLVVFGLVVTYCYRPCIKGVSSKKNACFDYERADGTPPLCRREGTEFARSAQNAVRLTGGRQPP
jgi:hypothetical protein